MAADSAGVVDGDSIAMETDFELTPSEARLFQLLRVVAQDFELDVSLRVLSDWVLAKHFKLDVSLRVLGDWVLAQMMGQRPGQIYVAVSGMSARLYSDKVTEYLLKSKQYSQGEAILCMGRIKQIGAPCIMFSGKLVYFVNIRSGTFTGAGKSLVMERPYDSEDLYHADLTINSLIYNINDSRIHDATGKGFDHIKGRLIVTPPKAPVRNDPLIVLRAIRFAAQLNFELDEVLQRSACDRRVKIELGNNISRTKISREITLMLACKRPIKAMTYVQHFGLFYTVFEFPNKTEPPIDEHCDRCCCSCVESLAEVCNLLHSIENSVFSGSFDPMVQEEQRIICLYAALFLTLSETVYMDEYNRKAPAVAFILRGTELISCNNGASLSNIGPLQPLRMRDIPKSVALIHTHCERFAELVALLESNSGLNIIKNRLKDKFFEIPSEQVKRLFAGLLLYEVKELWRISLFLSIVHYAANETMNVSLSSQDISERKIEIYRRTEKAIVDLGIDNIWKISPLLDQKSIRDVVLLPPEDPQVGEWQERLVAWQIIHPEGSANEFIEWMKQSYDCMNKKFPSTTLKDYFTKAKMKINANENHLLKRVAIVSKQFSVAMKDDCCRVASSLVEILTGEHVSNRSWDGQFTLDSFGYDENRVYIIERAKYGANSSSRTNDCRQLASLMRTNLSLDGELPAYLSHLLKELERHHHGPLTESMKLSFDSHFSLLTSENRIALTYLIKLKIDGLTGKEKQRFIAILDKCGLEPDWITLRKIPIFQKIIDGGKERNVSMYDCTPGYAAFKLLRHYFTHAPEHSGEPGMHLLKDNCVLDHTAWKYLGDFAAEVVFKLIRYDADIRREYGEVQPAALDLFITVHPAYKGTTGVQF
ncbi:hypothetical protein ACP4OV_030588 [Aristida adscensionis]